MQYNNRNLIVFPQEQDLDDLNSIIGISDSGEKVKVTLDPSSYLGNGEPPSLSRFLDPTRTGSAIVRKDNGPELYSHDSRLASALLFKNVVKTSNSEIPEYVSGYATVLSPGVRENISGVELEQARNLSAPYLLGVGHVNYSIGQSRYHEGVGFLETAYLVEKNWGKPVEQTDAFARPMIEAYGRFLEAVNVQKDILQKKNATRAIAASADTTDEWANFIVECAKLNIVKPKVRFYYPDKAISLKGDLEKGKDFFLRTIRAFSKNGLYGGVYYRLRNTQTGHVLPNLSAVLMNSYDPETSSPKDPSLQFDSFIQYLGGGHLFKEVSDNEAFTLDLIPLREIAISPSSAKFFLEEDRIRNEINKTHCAVPSIGYNAKLSAIACPNLKVGGGSILTKIPQFISPHLQSIVDAPIGNKHGLLSTPKTIKDVEKVTEVAMTCDPVRVEGDLSSRRINPASRI